MINDKLEMYKRVICDTHFALQIGLDTALSLDLPFEEDVDESYIRGFGEPFLSKIASNVDEIYMILLEASSQELLERRRLREKQGIRPRSLNPINLVRESYFEKKYFEDAFLELRRIRNKRFIERHTINTSETSELDLEEKLIQLTSKKLILLRHADTSWNTEGRFIGQKDVGLSQEGERQAYESTRKLSGYHIDKIYYSPLKRATQTAEILAKLHPESKSICDPDLIERNYGEWEGNLIAKIAQELGPNFNMYAEDFSPPSGETLSAVQKRIKRFYGNLSREENLIICSHFTPLMCLSNLINGVPFSREEDLPPNSFRIIYLR